MILHVLAWAGDFPGAGGLTGVGGLTGIGGNGNPLGKWETQANKFIGRLKCY